MSPNHFTQNINEAYTFYKEKNEVSGEKDLYYLTVYFSSQKYYFHVNESGVLMLIDSLDSVNVRWILWEIPNFEVIDTLGDWQGDPGSGWDVAGVSNATKDHTLIRKPNVTKGNTDWNASRGTTTENSEWIVKDKDDISNLKQHTINIKYDLSALDSAGYTTSELRTAGFTAKQLYDLNSTKHTLSELDSAGYTTSELKTAGFTAKQLYELNSTKHTLSSLDSAGYTTENLKDAGFTAKQLNTFNSTKYSIFELNRVGYDGIYGTLEYTVTTDNGTDPIINVDGSFIIERSNVSNTIKFKYLFIDNGTTNDGLKLYQWNNLSNLTSINKYDKIPLVRNGSQFYYTSSTISLPTDSNDLPTILPNTSLLWCFGNSTINYGNISYWVTSNVTTMESIFSGATLFNQPIGDWNVGNVTNMSWMFRNATAFNQDISDWNVGNVTNMDNMFRDASAFNKDIGGWNVGNVADMRSMFFGASAFNQPLEQLNMSNVRRTSYMFTTASAFNQPIEQWDVGNVTDMERMFYGASAFNQPLGQWNVSNVKKMRIMFYNGIFDQPIGNWNVSNVTAMDYMFYNTPFNQPIGNWNVSNVKNMRVMFYDTIFNQPIGNWDVSNVTAMDYMFRGYEAFDQPIGNWNVSNVKNMKVMFYNTRFNQYIGDWNVSNVTDMESMFHINSAFNQPIGNWNVSSVTNMNDMFYDAAAFNQPIGQWERQNGVNGATSTSTIGNVTQMGSLFRNTPFNQDISNWDVSSVENFGHTFAGTTNFNQPIGNWNVSNVTDMISMFNTASSFNQSIGNWDVSNVTDMTSMFQNASSFNQSLKNLFNYQTSTTFKLKLEIIDTNVNNYGFVHASYANTIPKVYLEEIDTNGNVVALVGEMWTSSPHGWAWNGDSNNPYGGLDSNGTTLHTGVIKEFNLSKYKRYHVRMDQSFFKTNNWTTEYNFVEIDGTRYESGTTTIIEPTTLLVDKMILNNGMTVESYSQFLKDLYDVSSINNIVNLDFGFTGKIRFNDTETNNAYNYLTTTKGYKISDGGSHTQSEISSLNSSNTSVIILNTTGVTKTIINTTYLLDSGGLSGIHSGNEDYNISFNLPANNKFVIKYNTELETNNDFLKIYQGTTDVGTTLVKDFNSSTSLEGTLNITSSNIYISFISNATEQYSGFKLEIIPTLVNQFTSSSITVDPNASLQEFPLDNILDNPVGTIINTIESKTNDDSSLFTFNSPLKLKKLDTPIRNLSGSVDLKVSIKATDEESQTYTQDIVIPYEFNNKYYLYGTNNSISGYYYPLYIKAPSTNSGDYTTYTFLEYPGITFYGLNNDFNSAKLERPSTDYLYNFLVPYYIYGTGDEGKGYYYPVYTDLPSSNSSFYKIVKFSEYERDFYVANNYYKTAVSEKPSESQYSKFLQRYHLYGTSESSTAFGQEGYYYPLYIETPSSNSSDYTTIMFSEYPSIEFYMLNNDINTAKTNRPSIIKQTEEYIKTGWYAALINNNFDSSNKTERIFEELALITNENDDENENNPELSSSTQVRIFKQKTLEEVQMISLIKSYKQDWTYNYNRTFKIKGNLLQFIEFYIYRINGANREYIKWNYFKNQFEVTNESITASPFKLEFYENTSYIRLMKNLHEKILLLDKESDTVNGIKFIDYNTTNLDSNKNNSKLLLPYYIKEDSVDEITDDTIIVTTSNSINYFIDFV